MPNFLFISKDLFKFITKEYLQNRETLQIFTINIKTEGIYKIYYKCQAGRLGYEVLVV